MLIYRYCLRILGQLCSTWGTRTPRGKNWKWKYYFVVYVNFKMYFRCGLEVYNLNDTSAILGMQTWRQIVSRSTHIIKIEYQCFNLSTLYIFQWGTEENQGNPSRVTKFLGRYFDLSSPRKQSYNLTAELTRSASSTTIQPFDTVQKLLLKHATYVTVARSQTIGTANGGRTPVIKRLDN
jgi:hypothetical protein